MRKLFSCLLAVGALASTVFAQSQVNISTNVKRQTMDGLGFAATGQWYAETAAQFQDPAFAAAVTTDLKPAIVRIELPETFQIEPDLDLNNFDFTKYNFNAFEPQGTMVANMRAINPNLKVMITVWTPPAWMKTNGNVEAGSLKPENYGYFAKYCATAAKAWEMKYGYKPHVFSLQNEPLFPNPFHSCVYTPETFRDTLKVIDATFWQFGINPQVQLTGSENHAFIKSWVTDWAAAIYNDPQSRAALDIHAIHGYATDGVVNRTSFVGWQQLASQLAPYPFPKTWMTEDSGQHPYWTGTTGTDGAILLVEHIHNAIAGGSVNAWVHWMISMPWPSTEALMWWNGGAQKTETTGKYWGYRQFSRYIQPGMIRVDATQPDGLLVSAFINPKKPEVTVIAINPSFFPLQVDLNFTLPGPKTTLRKVIGTRSSEFENGVIIPNLTIKPGNKASTTLPKQSITSFVATYGVGRK
jgi:glucuronoarabinoxylan endo-1,4-beta-xylanase